MYAYHHWTLAITIITFTTIATLLINIKNNTQLQVELHQAQTSAAELNQKYDMTVTSSSQNDITIGDLTREGVNAAHKIELLEKDVTFLNGQVTKQEISNQALADELSKANDKVYSLKADNRALLEQKV